MSALVFESALGYGRDLTITHADLVLLTRWMVDNDYSADDIAYAIEKPWKYTAELDLAKSGKSGVTP